MRFDGLSGTIRAENRNMNLFSSRYGPRIRPTGLQQHLGIDLVCPLRDGNNNAQGGIGNVPIIAVTSGRTTDRSANTSGTGYRISIESDEFFCPLTGRPLIFTVMHMVAPASVGQGISVTRGQTIGYVGDTGSTGAIHLHFEVTSRGFVNFNHSRETRLPYSIDPTFFYPAGTFYWAPWWQGTTLLRDQRTRNFTLWSETQTARSEW